MRNGIGLDLELALAALEGVAGEREQLAGRLVGHRIAARRRAGAVDHEVGAGAAEGPVIGVGVADVEGEVVARLRVHLRRGDDVEALRRLAVAFHLLRPEPSRPLADLVGLEERILPVAPLLPDLELRTLP